MAILTQYEKQTRRQWAMWSVELILRGCRPTDSIIIHGPHLPVQPRMWGSARCHVLSTTTLIDHAAFETVGRTVHIDELPPEGLRVRSTVNPVHEYTPIHEEALPQSWRNELARLRRIAGRRH